MDLPVIETCRHPDASIKATKLPVTGPKLYQTAREADNPAITAI